jgi:hypothetical protein
MSKLISDKRVKEIVANVFINVSGTCPLDALNALIHAAIDKEPASECQKCKEAEKYNMTTRKFMHFLKELEKNFNRTPTYHELIEKNKELEQQLTDYFHTSSHKVKDKRIKELEDKVRSLQHGIDNKVMVVGQKDLVDRIKELEEVCGEQP